MQLILDRQVRYSVSLTRKNDGMLGFVRNGRRIVKIYDGSPASKNGKIKTGDEIVAINHKEVLNVDDISRLFRESGSSIIITMSRRSVYKSS